MKHILNRAFGLRGVLTLLALTVVFAATAQNKITGKVTDENNQPAIGANVVVKGTTQGVSTDLKGTYTLSVKKGAVLVFSYLGYKQQEVTVNTQTVTGAAFRSLAEAVVTETERRNREQPPTHIVEMQK